MGEGVAHEVHPTALPGRLQHLGHSGLEALMGIGDHQLHSAQATAHQTTQEVRPERLGFRGADAHAEDFAHTIGIHRHGDYHRDRDDPPGLPYLDVSGIDPQVGPVALDGPVEEGMHALIDLAGQA
ncbi:hypothetical protein D3C81_1787200 [compost metagenome]